MDGSLSLQTVAQHASCILEQARLEEFMYQLLFAPASEQPEIYKSVPPIHIKHPPETMVDGDEITGPYIESV
jgi:hypothetical protein